MHPGDAESFSGVFRLVVDVLGLVMVTNPARVGSDQGWTHPETHFALGLSNRVNVVTPCHLVVN